MCGAWLRRCRSGTARERSKRNCEARVVRTVDAAIGKTPLVAEQACPQATPAVHKSYERQSDSAYCQTELDGADSAVRPRVLTVTQPLS